ncbi:20854_t:CDS:1, partial [Dentiscutata erythropus]
MSSKISIRLFICTLLFALLIIQALAIPISLPKLSQKANANKALQPTSASNAKTPKSTAAAVKKVKKAKKPTKTSVAGPQKSSTTDGQSLVQKVTKAAGSAGQGSATFYNTGLGACGITSNDQQLVAALPAAEYDKLIPGGNPNACTACGKTCTVSYQGKTVDVKIVDRCPSCGSGDIDLSPAAFSCLADQALGRIQ